METLREKSSSHLILLHPLGVQPGPFRWVSVSTIYRWCPGWEWDVSFQTPRKCTVCYKPWTEKMFIVLELWLQALFQCLRGSFRKRSSSLVCLTPAISKRRQGTSKAQGRDFESCCRGECPPNQPRDHIGQRWKKSDIALSSLYFLFNVNFHGFEFQKEILSPSAREKNKVVFFSSSVGTMGSFKNADL